MVKKLVADVLRLDNFLSRNGHPHQRLDPETDAQVRALANTAGQEITYTCVPPGSGERMGIDRDEDGFYDFDEILQGTDPAAPDGARPMPWRCTRPPRP